MKQIMLGVYRTARSRIIWGYPLAFSPLLFNARFEHAFQFHEERQHHEADNGDNSL